MTDPNSKQVAGSHYKATFQHWDLVDATGMGYFEGQVSKYITRHKLKNGVQDVEKAIHFMEKYLSILNRDGVVHRHHAQPTADTLRRYVFANSLERPEAGVVWACMAWTHVGQLEDVLATMHSIRAEYTLRRSPALDMKALQEKAANPLLTADISSVQFNVDPGAPEGDMSVEAFPDEHFKQMEIYVLAELVHYVKKWKLVVPSPDYIASGTYAPQWRALGSVYSWRCPRTGNTIALIDKATERYIFAPQGMRSNDGSEPDASYVNQG